MKRLSIIVTLLMLGSTATAQEITEVNKMRANTVETRAPRDLPAALAPNASWSWQPAAPPKLLRQSQKVIPSAEYAYAARTSKSERGYVERFRPATEQLALGLSSDPPRPAYPYFAPRARTFFPSASPFDVLNIAPLSKTSDAKIDLARDPATVETKPYTAPIATASRGAAPPRAEIGVPDPFLAEREIKLKTTPADADPPAISFGAPERPLLPVLPPPMPVKK